MELQHPIIGTFGRTFLKIYSLDLLLSRAYILRTLFNNYFGGTRFLFGDITFTYFDQELMRYLLKKTDASQLNSRYGLISISSVKHANFLFFLNFSNFVHLSQKRKDIIKHAQNANCRLKKFHILEKQIIYSQN